MLSCRVSAILPVHLFRTPMDLLLFLRADTPLAVTEILIYTVMMKFQFPFAKNDLSPGIRLNIPRFR